MAADFGVKIAAVRVGVPGLLLLLALILAIVNMAVKNAAIDTVKDWFILVASVAVIYLIIMRFVSNKAEGRSGWSIFALVVFGALLFSSIDRLRARGSSSKEVFGLDLNTLQLVLLLVAVVPMVMRMLGAKVPDFTPKGSIYSAAARR
jgi:hypothetical protein